MTNFVQNIIRTIIGLVISVIATQIFAQSTSDNQNVRVLEEIIVTAQKRTENLQDVPISVSAFSGEGIRSAAMSKLETLSETVPNFLSENLLLEMQYLSEVLALHKIISV